MRGAMLTMDPLSARVKSGDDAPVGVVGCIAASSPPNLSRSIISRGDSSSVSPVAQSASLEAAEHVHLPRGGTPPKTRPPRWEADGVTECSVRRKLTTADPKDRDVSLSGLEIIWALGPTDDLYSQHDRKGSGRLVLTR